MIHKKLMIITAVLLVLPVTSLAIVVPTNAPGTIAGFSLGWLINVILDFIWIIFFAFSIIMFIWAGFQFLSAQGEPEGVKTAQKSVMWGAVGVAVAIVAFSLPRILVSWLGGG